jgi:hypothetical protein
VKENRMTKHLHVVAATTAATLSLAMADAMAAATTKAPIPDDPAPALAAVKQSPNAKIGPWLDNLFREYREAKGKGVADKQFRTKIQGVHVVAGKVSVEMYAKNGAALRKTLAVLDATHIMRVGSLVSARVPVPALGKLAADPSLAFAHAALAKTQQAKGPVISQGVESMRAATARESNNVDGSGVTVGVLSDSFGCNPGPFFPGTPTTTLQQDQNTDELPTEVTILKDGPCPLTDEGRGIGQIIHDVAPGSPIAFHTAWESELDFAEGIQRLQDTAGAGVIVDDVIWFEEPMFSDGMVAQAVDIVTAKGVPYFSSAGNQARASYESVFRGVNVNVNASGNVTGAANRVARFHDLDPGPDVRVLQPIVVDPQGGASAFTYVVLQWDQPFKTSTTYAWKKAGKSDAEAAALAKGATTDLDIVIYDYKGHLLPQCPPGVANGITCQITGDRNIGGDAVDQSAIYYSGPPKGPQLFYVGIVVTAGADPQHVKEVYFEEAGTYTPQAFATNSGTAYGHANAAGANSVGAASWYTTVPYSTSGKYPPNDTYKTPPIAPSLAPCVPACLEDFSSAGRIPIYLDKFGNRLDSAIIRENPAFTGPDGGNSTFFFSDSSYDDDDQDGFNSPLSTFITPLDSDPSSEHPNFFGTSASAPHAAAVAALMLQKNPTLTPQHVRTILQDTAHGAIDQRFTSARPAVLTPITLIDGYNFDAGTGLVDAVDALDAVP